MSIGREGHTFKRFDQDLAQLNSLVMKMGGLVEEQIKDAVQALVDGDVEAAREVIARDHVVNGLDVRITEEVTQILALRAPMGVDLRMLVSVSKTVTDLERIGDEAEKIARMAIHIHDGPGTPPNHSLYRDIYAMSGIAAGMVHGVLDALARMDAEGAVDIARQDVDLDDDFRSALRRLITYMMEDPRTIGHAIDVLFVIKALERIGDHAKNIGEYVVYLVKGKDIRHTSTDKEGVEERIIGDRAED